MKKNEGATDIKLTTEEVRQLDVALDQMVMSEVFGSSRMEKDRRSEK